MMLSIECEVNSDPLVDDIIEWRVNSYLFKLHPNVLKHSARIGD